VETTLQLASWGGSPAMTIQERFAKYPGNYFEEKECDWGDDVGEEILV